MADFWISVTAGHRGGGGGSAEIFSKELRLISGGVLAGRFSFVGMLRSRPVIGGGGGGQPDFFRIFRSRGFWTIP